MPKANPWPGRPGEWPTHCPLCFGALEPLPGAGGYARHRSARCSAQCVLTTRQYQPEELTIRGSRDVQVAAGHRERFVAHWVRHYTLMRRAWPALTIARFIAVIACADVADLWSYRMLRDDDLAAVLLVLAGFLRVPDALGTEAPGTDTRAPTVRWVRFWFDASVRDVGDQGRRAAARRRCFVSTTGNRSSRRIRPARRCRRGSRSTACATRGRNGSMHRNLPSKRPIARRSCGFWRARRRWGRT